MSAQTLYQLSEPQQIRHSEERAAPAHDDFHILGNKIRPLWGYRADDFLINLEQEPFAMTIKPFTHAAKLLPTEGVERMSNPHKARRCR